MDRRAGDGPQRGHAWAAVAVGGCMHDGSQQEEAGVFRGSVMELLSRDPSQRPSMEHFCELCDRVLAGTTTVQL